MSSASPILGYERKPPQPMTATRAYVRAMDFFRDDAGKIGLSAVLIVLSSLASLLQPFPGVFLVIDDEHARHQGLKNRGRFLPVNGKSLPPAGPALGRCSR